MERHVVVRTRPPRHTHDAERIGDDDADGSLLDGVTPNGRYVYVTNTGSGSISGYRVDFDGQLPVNDDGRTGNTGSGSTPIDIVITDSGRYLYNLNGGTNTIGAFRIHSDGSLTRLPFIGGLPPGANGLAAR